MRRVDPETWAGIVLLAVVVGLGAPALIGLVDTTIPRIWWIAAFITMLGAVLAAFAFEHRTGPRHLALGTAVAASWIVVAGAPNLGFLPILLIAMAALSVYTTRLAGTAVIVLLNTLVIGAIGVRYGDSLQEAAIVTGLYLALQAMSVLSSLAIIREQQLRRQLTEAHVELRAATALLSESARTAERLRISRDLHDTIGHQLTVLTLEFEAARHREGERAREHVERAQSVARNLLRDVRSTVGELRNGSADLAATLGEIVKDLPGLRISLDVEPAVEVGEDESTALILAVQEIITNTIRHAGAHELWIEIARDPSGATVLTAADDGRGADRPVLGNGLRGMKERFEEIGGNVRIGGSGTRRGFTVTARVPAS
ncbi:histidine kinase [Hoyosella altamirensis]|uniref:Signal transduction histidine kinase n=1 Tax=Hoyosella altamirensis TaxID=616997 RepID=A0A839RVI9_9ACTN|nr:histidine kinase [Hoyosella altamirensis]MBB3039791.1 signal transduction histidine kinase [Hoyosella altamirensis]